MAEFKIITGISIPDFDLGGIQTEYTVTAPNLSDAKIDAEKLFKSDFPILSYKYPVTTKCINP